MPIIHPNSAYPHISNLGNHWIHALSGRISLNTKQEVNEMFVPGYKNLIFNE